MASFRIRQFQERDYKQVVDVFSRGMEEHIPTAFRHLLTLPRTLLLLAVVPLAIVLVSGSWFLAVVCIFFLFLFLWFLASKPWKNYVSKCLHTDMADITRTYMSSHSSCFWVAESRGQTVGMVAARPVKDPLLQKKQLQLLHLSVSLQHRREGLGKAMVRTVLQFAQMQGFSEVVLSTSMLQYAALALYQGMGFQKTGETFYTYLSRLRKSPMINLKYSLTSPWEGDL